MNGETELLIVPPGKALGCLPRKRKYGDVCPIFRDKLPSIPRDKWKDLIGQVSLRLNVRQILDQDGIGSCATEAAAQSLMIVRDFGGQKFELLNPLFIYHTTGGGRDGGSSIDDNLVFIREKGCVPESVWPRSKGFRATPSPEAYVAALKYRADEFYDIASVEEMGTALLIGFPVVFGWQGHSCVMVALISDTEALYANSWDPTWGDHGFGTVKLKSVEQGYGTFALRTVLVRSDETPPPTFKVAA